MPTNTPAVPDLDFAPPTPAQVGHDQARARRFQTRLENVKRWVSAETLTNLEALLGMIQVPLCGSADRYGRELQALQLAGYTLVAAYQGTTLLRGTGGYLLHDYYDGLRASVESKHW